MRTFPFWITMAFNLINHFIHIYTSSQLGLNQNKVKCQSHKHVVAAPLPLLAFLTTFTFQSSENITSNVCTAFTMKITNTMDTGISETTISSRSDM